MHCQLVKEEWLVEKNMIGKCFCNIVELINSYMFLPSQLVILVRGPRRVKRELGFAYFSLGK
jgi:hypothetical protein